MLTVHHLNNSRSQRILWMLEELGIEYEIRFHKRRPDMFAPDELKKVHPLGKAPVVEDWNREGQKLVLVETGAICEYLIGKADGRLGPSSERDEILKYREFLHYAEGSVMPLLFALLVVSQVPLLGRLAVKRVRPMLDTHLDYVEAQLSSRAWFAGEEFTAADVMMSFPLEAARSRKWLDGGRPATIAWLDRIHSRPSYQKALKRGGPYVFA
ncbi:glutathione S-transferase family protein [Rhizobium rhizogenes]|uniref:glutathione S-transferase family protein n=1 Tax=Rhizobium rhizogenes TaxID=359 RepID=UPI0015745F9B|nr:glutathione S-transferase [Rhizobium rhizogenes]NTF44113.1 glutathione S-transferase [Rhizobium rhizogenes]